MAMFNSYVTLPEGKFSEYEYVKYVNSNSSDLSSGKHGWKMLHFTSMIAF